MISDDCITVLDGDKYVLVDTDEAIRALIKRGYCIASPGSHIKKLVDVAIKYNALGIGIEDELWDAVRMLANEAEPGVETDGLRDPENICTDFMKGDRVILSSLKCDGDGHYLCKKCVHWTGRQDHSGDR